MAQDSSLAAAWIAHKRTRGAPPKAVPTRYDAACVIAYVPVGGVYRGHREIEVLLEQMRATHHYIESTEVLSTVFSGDTVVEESLLTIRHERPIEYLLPGLRDTGRVLTCAMCTVSTFREDKLLSQRVYWDHASLLRQAGLLPQNVRSGRAGAEANIKVAGNEVGAVVKAAIFRYAKAPESTLLPTKQEAVPQAFDKEPLAPGKSTAEHDDQTIDADGVSPSRTYQKQHIATARDETPEPYGGAEVNVANRSNPVTGQRQSVRLYAPPGGVSQISFAGRDLEITDSHNGQRQNPRSTIQSEDLPSDGFHKIAGNGSATRDRGTLGFDHDAEPVRSTRPANANPVQNQGGAPVTGSRVSVRLFAPPGGKSQISFG